MRSSKESAGRRLRVITIDQAIAGASNVLIAVLAARLLSVASFGLFGIVFLVYSLGVGVSRGLVSDPLLVHPQEAQEQPGNVIGTSCVLGVILAGLLLVVGLGTLVVDARLGAAFLVLGACMPLLVLQDLGRYLGFATRSPSFAVVLDLAWLVLQFAAVAALFVTDTRALAWFVAAWAGSGAVAGLLLFGRYSAADVRLNLSWLRYTWGFSWRYLISYVASQGGAIGASSGVGAIAGSRALGGFQGATLLVRPFQTIQAAAVSANVGEISRSLANRAQVRRHLTRTTSVTTVAALINALVILLMPTSLGKFVLGASWHVAQPLLLPMGVQILWAGIITGPRAGLLGMRAIRKAMKLDVASTIVLLTGTVIGAGIDGAKGALWAVAFGQGVLALVWWMTFSSHSSSDESQPASAGPAAIGSVSVSPPPV